MSDLSRPFPELPPEQRSIRAKCFHPSGSFVEFRKEEIEQSIPDRFEQQVAKYPDRIAVKTRNHQFTYDALNKMANRVAHAILERFGEDNEPIALLLENDAPMIAAILGVLKAGKIYVPLDPASRNARTSYVLEDSQSVLIVTDDKNFSFAKGLAGKTRPLVNIDELDSGSPFVNPGLSMSAYALSWIRYTSGSTGQPKGVFTNHRKVLFHTMINTNSFHICSEDRINTQGYDIFAALLNGASFYPLDIKEEGLSRLAKSLILNEITVHCSIPSLFRHFLGTLTGEENFPNLRLIELEGEMLSKRDVEMYKQHFCDSCILVNKLGSRETAGFRQYFIDKETQIDGNIVPVGYAVEGKEVLLLDDNGQKLGHNQVGEIAVKSRYLAAGYWRRPDLTKEAFPSDPEGGDERIYRTGDLGRMLPDGCLVYLGRKDSQVKIRGNRVEVAETEMALVNLDGVKEAVVVAREDRPGEERLVAYVVPHKQPPPSVAVVRRALAEKLPDYMIPSTFVILDALPLLPDGKLDRHALLMPAPVRPELDTPFVSPRTPVEEALAGIWAEVLDLDHVGIHDNFLDLGGHSLLATRVISRVINQFQVELPVQSLFGAPTVAEMAVVITQNQAKEVGQEEMARVLSELEALSDDEAQHLLAQEMPEKQV